eukprot:CAMPEP_0203895280 /NCGR_PEP_ID=MMETSP0359-20131031/38150_1 /ASSEMBLY_ACC=CAM_ASM_000338 /TAXON_ID=268821 /ORGANISM="Scrippsiella Hangoei, Strain SHTV-5" /LENGTH=42 /DNA_ID= /DNA_START= /DNA_END= /DNA_ORIENTATION=
MRNLGGLQVRVWWSHGPARRARVAILVNDESLKRGQLVRATW